MLLQKLVRWVDSVLNALPPCVEILKSNAAVFEANPTICFNVRTFDFTIKLYQEQSQVGKTKEEADALMTQAADAILLAFDQDKDLGGEVEIVRVVAFDLDFKVATGTFNFANFHINCVVIVPNYS